MSLASRRDIFVPVLLIMVLKFLARNNKFNNSLLFVQFIIIVIINK